MNILETVILGIVQGLTEWLPVSSDGHLVLFEKWLGIAGASLSFDIFLHLASLLVVGLFFWKQIREIFLDFFRIGPPSRERHHWGWYLILSSAVTALVGYLLYDYVVLLRQPKMVAVFLIVSGIFVLATRFFQGQKKINIPLALLLGLMQGLAVLPGLSRSGVVIGTALIGGLKKNDAFEYGFILLIPAISGAFILSLPQFVFQPYLWLGFVVTAVVSWLALSWLRSIMKHNYFYLFSFYTLILGLIIILL